MSAWYLSLRPWLRPVSGMPFATAGPNPSGLAARDGRLYVANSGSGGTVSAFEINESPDVDHPRRVEASLTELEGSPFDAPGNAVGSIVVSPNGRWLYTARGFISGFALSFAEPPYLSDVRGSPYPALARELAVAGTLPGCAGRRGEMLARGRAMFRATPGADVIVGDSAGNTIDALGGADLMCATGGGDSLTAGRGNDRLYGQRGRDRIAGGKGNDRLSGGSKGDRLNGGSGRDSIAGGAGNDRILVADAEKDIVDCGPGRDHAKADSRDRLSRCDRVLRRR